VPFTSQGDITRLLHRMGSEIGAARKRTFDELVTIVYGDLRRRAHQQLANERPGSLQPTLLVHEAYERLLNYRMSFENREHFLNAAAKAMRRIVIDRARKMNAAKRGSGQQSVTLSQLDVVGVLQQSPELLLDLDRAIDELRPDQIQLTELRFFAGFTFEETAQVMSLKSETVKKRWEVIRTILFDKLESVHSLGPRTITAKI
jgi:RNA polymerase sigma factor (TIGR02999 family)